MKKILTTIFIAVLAVVLAIVPMAGCAETECTEHSVGSWRVVTAATCSTPGLKEGYCGICGKLIQEEIEIDPDAHVYSDWDITVPTLTSRGIAVKTCSECGDRISTFLPVLSDTSYTSAITVRPSATTAGKSKYTYTSEEYGEISFEIDIDETGIQTVGDAVSVGTMTESHNMIRSVTGVRGDKRVDSGYVTDAFSTTSSSTSSFSYELYDEYTHLISVDSSEYWMGLDDGEIYGYYTDEQGNFTIAEDTNYFYGFRYYLNYTDTLSYYYGTENFLAGLYAYAKKNVNGDFKESVNADGSYSFSFGTYTIYSVGTNGALFSKIDVTFTLTESYTIDTLKYSSITYANDSTAYDASTGEWGSDATFLFDEDGYAYVTAYTGLKFVETYEVTQTERQEGETELTNKYTPDTRFYTDFDITYNGSTVNYTSEKVNGTTTDYTAASTAELVAGTRSGYDFTITNFTPSDAIGDTITFYYKQEISSGVYNYEEIDINTESSVGIFVHMKESNDNKGDYIFCIKSNITGDVTIAVCSQNVTKEFTLTFTSNAPSILYPTVYNYNSSSGYVANTPSGTTTTNTATVYVGQPLYFDTALSSSEAGSCTKSFTTTVTYSGSATDYDVTDSTSVTNSSSEVVPVSSFTAYKAGTYVLTLTSDVENCDASCTITVTVVDAPTLDSIFTGTYTGRFSMTNGSVTVTFGEITKEAVSYTDGSGTTIQAYKCTVTATVDYIMSMEVECTYYTSLDGSIVYNISYTQVYAAEDMVTSEMLSTAPSDEYYFTISLNEAFCLTVTHTLGDAYDGANESAVLK